MRRRAGSSVLLVLALAAASLALYAGPAGAVTFSPCPDDPTWGCTTLPVPLDRSAANPVPGQITLAVRRRLANPAGPSPDAVLPLAGGPGQAAIPLFHDFAAALAPALSTRDLIVYDQRGTGASSPLQCAAFETPSTEAVTVASCARELGARRQFFTTPDSVADMEAIRTALGYRRLAVYGASYGTKVALQYAIAHPAQTESLVLDSTVSPSGPDVFQRSSFAAVDRVLSDLCAANACRGITSDPVGEMARLVARLRAGGLRGPVVDANGHLHHVHLGPAGLFSALVSGDENPELRAAVPGSVHSALHGDGAPLLRLVEEASTLNPSAFRPRQPVPRQALNEAPFNDVLNVVTTCSELQFPWSPTSAPASRPATAAAAANSIPPALFAPFDRTTAVLQGAIPECLSWPADASRPGPAPLALSGIPTLILSGAADLRTPTEDALAVSHQISGSQLLVVPHNGHSVLSTDVTRCSGNAVSAFYLGNPVLPCPSAANPFPPSPLAPMSPAGAGAVAGTHGRVGSTLAAMRATLNDVRATEVGQIIAAGPLLAGERFGGLRGGHAVVDGSGLRLVDYSYIPGVSVSGVLPPRASHRSARLTLAGPAADHGVITLSPGAVARGRLAGHRIDAAVGVAARATGASPVSGASLAEELAAADLAPRFPGLARVR